MNKALIAVAAAATMIAIAVSGVANAAPVAPADQAMERVAASHTALSREQAREAERSEFYLPPDYEVQQQSMYRRVA